MKRTVTVETGLAFFVLALMMLLASSPCRSENLLANGGFEAGNAGFSTEYSYQYWVLDPQTYYIGSNPNDHHPSFYSMGPQEGLLMMIANGAIVPDVMLWREAAIPVLPNTDYYFSTWVATVTAEGPATLLFQMNGAELGTLTPLPMGAWIEFYATWNSGSSTTADVTVIDLGTEFSGNDFVMDNMVLDLLNPVPSGKTTWGRIKGICR